MVSHGKDSWDKLKIIAWVFVSVSTLGWTVASWFLLQIHENKATERQIQATIAAAELQRLVSVGQLAAALMPSLNGTEAERRSGLLILASVAPDIADKVSTGLAQSISTPVMSVKWWKSSARQQPAFDGVTYAALFTSFISSWPSSARS